MFSNNNQFLQAQFTYPNLATEERYCRTRDLPCTVNVRNEFLCYDAFFMSFQKADTSAAAQQHRFKYILYKYFKLYFALLPFLKLPMALGMQQPTEKDISDRIRMQATQ